VPVTQYYLTFNLWFLTFALDDPGSWPVVVVTLTLNRNWMITLTHAQSTTTTTGHDPGSSSALNALKRSKVKLVTLTLSWTWLRCDLDLNRNWMITLTHAQSTTTTGHDPGLSSAKVKGQRSNNIVSPAHYYLLQCMFNPWLEWSTRYLTILRPESRKKIDRWVNSIPAIFRRQKFCRQQSADSYINAWLMASKEVYLQSWAAFFSPDEINPGWDEITPVRDLSSPALKNDASRNGLFALLNLTKPKKLHTHSFPWNSHSKFSREKK